MAIVSISISQSNVVEGSNLLPIHSPLVFLADVSYTGINPYVLYVDVIYNGEVLDTFKAIPYNDPFNGVRTFAFVANSVIKGLMGSFDDFLQLNNTLSYVENITKLVTIQFRDPANELTTAFIEVDLIHGAAQFGDYPNFADVYNNENKIYYGAKGSFVYAYFYNNDTDNIITVNSGTTTLEDAQDFNDDIFTDFNDVNFQIDVTP